MGVSSDWENLREAVHECLVSAFGDTVTCVIRQDQNGQRPELTYAAYKMNPYEQSGSPEYIYPVSGNIKQIDRYEIVISIQTYGRDAMSAMFDVRRKLKTKSFKDACYIAFCEAGLNASLLDATDILDVTQVIGTTFEQRAQMDLRLAYAQVTEDVGQDCKNPGLAVEKMVIGGNLERADDDPNPIETKQITVIDN